MSLYRTVDEDERHIRRMILCSFMIAIGIALMLIGSSAAASVRYNPPGVGHLPTPCVSHMTPLVEYDTNRLCPGVIPSGATHLR